jgi:helicase MOV-10
MHPAHWQAHQAGQPHRRRAAQERVAPNIDPIPANDHSRPEMAGHIRCTICHLDLQQRFWPQHVVGNRHKQREKIAAFQAAIEEGEKNKNGVTITSHGDFGVVDIAAAIAGISAHLLIETTVPGACMTIVDAKLGSVNGTSTSSP